MDRGPRIRVVAGVARIVGDQLDGFERAVGRDAGEQSDQGERHLRALQGGEQPAELAQGKPPLADSLHVRIAVAGDDGLAAETRNAPAVRGAVKSGHGGAP